MGLISVRRKSDGHDFLLLFLDEKIGAVQRHTAVIAHDAPAAVGVGQAREQPRAAG